LNLKSVAREIRAAAGRGFSSPMWGSYDDERKLMKRLKAIDRYLEKVNRVLEEHGLYFDFGINVNLDGALPGECWSFFWKGRVERDKEGRTPAEVLGEDTLRRLRRFIRVSERDVDIVSLYEMYRGADSDEEFLSRLPVLRYLWISADS